MELWNQNPPPGFFSTAKNRSKRVTQSLAQRVGCRLNRRKLRPGVHDHSLSSSESDFVGHPGPGKVSTNSLGPASLPSTTPTGVSSSLWVAVQYAEPCISSLIPGKTSTL